MATHMRQLAPADYPGALREIPQPPPALWLRGALPPTGTKLLAVVGSRAATPYGKEATARLIEGLSGYPISIVSGLALGTDGNAHRAALAAGLHTIAVPGSGLSDSVIYPRSHAGLATEILAAGGALLSEHEPEYRAAPHDFPSRNRIMVGLADAVLVIEAAERSGTLITARLAAEYNRDLLCVPHRMGDRTGFGAHLFIRLGAALVTEPRHILDALGLAVHERERVPTDLSAPEQIIFDLLIEPLTRDELLRASGMAANDALAALLTLELKGVAREEFGAWRRA